MIQIWVPRLIHNFDSFLKDEHIIKSAYFFNFCLPLDNDNCLFLSDGMHLEKRIRYEIVNVQNLFLVIKHEDKFQFASFYLHDFQKNVGSIVPNFVFKSSIQSKMDDDFPNLMFGNQVCSHALKESNYNNDSKIRKIATKWLGFCIIGSSLDLILNGNKYIKEENQFKALTLGFFLMYQIYKKTIPYPNLTRLFTLSVMREYLNLFVGFFREISVKNEDNIIIKRFGTFNLEHFFAYIRRYCHVDDHLFSIAHAFEKISALKIMKETDELSWFNDIHRKKIQDNASGKLLHWNWKEASDMFTLSEQLFNLIMSVDSMDKRKPYDFPQVLANQLFRIYGDLSNEEKNKCSQLNKSEIYSLSDISFHNKGSQAKSRLLLGSSGVYSCKKDQQNQESQQTHDSQQIQDNQQIQESQNEKGNIEIIASKRKPINNFSKKKYKIIDSYGPSFEVEVGSNLCFFNQSLHLILQCQLIYDWSQEKTPSKIKSDILIDLYFIANLYYNTPNNCLFVLNPAYQSLVELCLPRLNMNYGDMGDAADVIELVLSQFHYETPSTKRIYSSAFEIDLEGINYQFTGEYQIYSNNMIIYNVDDQYSMPDTCIEKTIIVPEIKSLARKFNIKKWMNYNLQYDESTQSYIPINIHQMPSLSSAIQASFYPMSNQIITYMQNEESGNQQDLIIENQINHSVQSFTSFPEFFIIKIKYISPRNVC